MPSKPFLIAVRLRLAAVNEPLHQITWPSTTLFLDDSLTERH